MRALFVNLAEDVEEERLNIEEKRFMIEKEFGHQAQVLERMFYLKNDLIFKSQA